MKAELIVNRTAGGGKPKKHISEILDYFDRVNFDYHISWTPYSGSAPLLVQQAIERGADSIISVGGDGTINEVINGIIQSPGEPTFGIIPAGWAHDFIKYLYT